MNLSCEQSRSPREGPPDDGAAAPCHVLLLGIEPAMAALIEEWLAPEGLRVTSSERAPMSVSLVLIDLPFPRRDGRERLRELAQVHPGVPVVVLSSTFFTGVAAQGEVAQQLGAAAVLATPVTRDSLRATVLRVLAREAR